MIKTEITWHDVSEEMPDRSADVVVAYSDVKYPNLVHYSKRKNKFNEYDDLPDSNERNTAGENVKFWCYKDELTACLW